jgi:two-component system alkaline phosphatase synthesis response regulator PhoP
MNHSSKKILLVDDEQDILEFLGYALRKEGYCILTAKTGQEAMDTCRRENPHLIILDIMMPEMDGIETCKELRAMDSLRHVPIAFLTARSEDYTQIAGFNAGADDYIIKPVRPKILLSRISALLRRTKAEVEQQEAGSTSMGLDIDREKYLVNKDGKSIQLRRREFELLSFLASKPGKVFTRDEILARVWGSGILVNGRTVDVHMNQLREKVGDKYFMTVKGVGYKYTM